MIIFSNQKSAQLAKEVAAGLKAEVGEIEKKVFPDGEIYVRIVTHVEGKDVILINTTKTSDDVIELILTLSALRASHAKKITCVVPHMAYQRQDDAFKPGEALSIAVLLNIYKGFADKLITVNAHFMDEAGEGRFQGIRVTNLDAFGLLGKHFKSLENPVVIAPDEGAMYYARSAAKALNCPYDHLVKKRLDGENVEMEPKDIDVKGKSVIILDDIISTGDTMLKAAGMLKKQGAKSVSLGCVHGIFTKGTDMFKGTDVVCTNSLPTPMSKVSLAPLIIGKLK